MVVGVETERSQIVRRSARNSRLEAGIEVLLFIDKSAVHNKQVHFADLAFVAQVHCRIGVVVGGATDSGGLIGTERTRKGFGIHSIRAQFEEVVAFASLPGEAPVRCCSFDVVGKADPVRGLGSSDMLRAIESHVAIEVVIPHAVPAKSKYVAAERVVDQCGGIRRNDRVRSGPRETIGRRASPQVLKRGVVVGVDAPDKTLAAELGTSGISEEITIIETEMVGLNAVCHLRVAPDMIGDLARIPEVHLLRKLDVVVSSVGLPVACRRVGRLDVDREGQGFQNR